MDRSRVRGGWLPAPIAVLLAIVLVATAPGGAARAADADEATPPTNDLLAIPDDAALDRLAGTTVKDSAEPLDGVIDMATLEEDALERLASLAADGWDPLALSGALDYDPDAAFAFLRDRIGFDPYRGELRGASGTLAARAGNSVDRALLLQELLTRMEVPARLAFGELSEAQAGDLLARSFQAPADPLPETPRSAEAALDWQAIGERAGRDYARLRAALGDRVATIGTADREAALEDLRHHAWVQAFIGTEWVDLDATMPDAQAGDTLTEALEIGDVVPEDEVSKVTISLVAETLDGSGLASTTVMDETLPAWEAADEQLILFFQPEAGGIGGSILEALGSAGAFVPHLSVAGDDRAGLPIPIRGATDIFSGEEVVGVELARLRLDIGTTLPDRPAVTASRTIIDRLPPGWDPVDDALDDLVLAPLTEDEAGPVDLQPVRHVMVSAGAASPWLAANDRAAVVSFINDLEVHPDLASGFDFAALFWPITVTNQALVLGAERTSLAAIDADPAVRAFVSEPRVIMVTLGGTPDRPVVTTDLVHDRIRVLEEPGAAPGASARAELWYGSLEAATETEFLRSLLRGFGGGAVDSISTATAAELTALDATAAGLDEMPASLRTALAQGLLAAVPGDPASAPGWWTVDPTDGTTRSVSRGGLGWESAADAGGRPVSTPNNPNPFRYKGPRAPLPRCTGSNEYFTPIGCVSLPGAIAFWGLAAAVTVAIAWGATVLWQHAIGYD